MFDPATSTYPIFPIYVHSGAATDKGVRGKLIGTYFTCKSLSNVGRGTIGNKTYAYISGSDNYPALMFDWDGTTEF